MAKAETDYDNLPHEARKAIREFNENAFYAAAAYVKDLKKAREYGCNTLWVFMAINQQKLYGEQNSYGHPDHGLINVNKYMRDMYGINHNQWKRGVDNLEAAGLIEVFKANGKRTRVKLLTKQPPNNRKKYPKKNPEATLPRA